MKRFLPAFIPMLLLFSACSQEDASLSPTPGTVVLPLSGTLVYEKEGRGIYEYSFRARTEAAVIADGFEPHQTASGEIVHLIGRTTGTGYTITGRIGLLNSSYSERTVLLDLSEETIGEPQMSPDGRYIAFSWVERSTSPFYMGPSGVVVVTRDGKIKVTADSMSHPAWTPDGRLVMDKNFRYYEGSVLKEEHQNIPGLVVTDTTLLSITSFLSGSASAVPAQPSVSPDGSRIAYILYGALYTVKIDGTDIRRLTNATTVRYPVWSPNGKWIAVNGTIHNLSNADSASAVAVIPTDASSPVILADESPYWVITPEGKILETSKQMSWR